LKKNNPKSGLHKCANPITTNVPQLPKCKLKHKLTQNIVSG